MGSTRASNGTGRDRQTDARRLLVLWDIDATLLRAGPLGRAIYGAAFARATGQSMRVQGSTSGRLDTDIYRDTLLAHELDPAAHPFPAFASALSAEYEAHAAELSEHGRALPGAADALEAVAREPHVVQTVLTGNLRSVARVKLTAVGLARHLDLAIGAYAEDAETRAGLVPVARTRAGVRHGAEFAAASTVLVGDSRHDVAAGRAAGVRVIAVATGQDGAGVLAEGADVVLDDLSDTAAVLSALLSG